MVLFNTSIMKRGLLFLSALCCTLLGFSQGIHFEQGTWKEVLAKAKLSNKPIFLNVYTAWSSTCKAMNEEVFPQELVGTFMNARFISYQVDAAIGEGIEMAEKFNTENLPYMFLTSDGDLFARFGGWMEAETFLIKTKYAMEDLNDPRPMSVWEKEYPTKRNDPVFLMNFMLKRLKLTLPISVLMDDYLKLMPKEGLTSDFVVKFYQYYGFKLNLNSLAFRNLQTNKTKLIAKNIPVDGMISSSMMYAVLQAAKTKDEKLLNAAIAIYDQLPDSEKKFISKDDLYVKYFRKSGESENFIKEFLNKRP